MLRIFKRPGSPDALCEADSSLRALDSSSDLDPSRARLARLSSEEKAWSRQRERARAQYVGSAASSMDLSSWMAILVPIAGSLFFGAKTLDAVLAGQIFPRFFLFMSFASLVSLITGALFHVRSARNDWIARRRRLESPDWILSNLSDPIADARVLLKAESRLRGRSGRETRAYLTFRLAEFELAALAPRLARALDAAELADCAGLEPAPAVRPVSSDGSAAPAGLSEPFARPTSRSARRL